MPDSMPDRESERISELEQALADLQTRFLFQEDTLQQLDDELIRLQGLVELLARKLEACEERIDQNAAGSPTGEKPPHY